MDPIGPVTEVALLCLKPGINIQDESSPAYQSSREAFSIISSQKGFQRIYYGHHFEDQPKFDVVIGACSQYIYLNVLTFLLQCD